MGKDALNYEEIKELISTTQDPATRALMAFQYLCAARIGELVKYTHWFAADAYRINSAWVCGEQSPGLIKSNIKKEIYDGKTVYYITLPNFKNPKLRWKTCVFVADNEPWLAEIVESWLNSCGEQVFNFRQSKARKLIRLACGERIIRGVKQKVASHYLRHSRATHLADVLPPFQLQHFLGHAHLTTTMLYYHGQPDFLQFLKDAKLEK